MNRTGSLVIAALGFLLFSQMGLADWTPAKRLTWTSGSSEAPAIAVDSTGDLHLAWHDNTPGLSEIFYKKSTDGGATWSASKRVTWTAGGSAYPVLAVDPSDDLHVVWWDKTPGNNEIYYTKSTDGGAIWTASQRLTWTSGSSQYPDLAVDPSGNLHVVWYDDTPGNLEIYYKKSTDGGSTWSTGKRLTSNSARSMDPAIAVDSIGTVHLIWSDESHGDLEIFHKKSTNGGGSWSSARRLTWGASGSYAVSVAIDSSDALHVVWNDYGLGNAEILYRRTTDRGISWAATQRLTWTSGDTREPAIAVDPAGGLHVVWQDSQPGNREAFYKRSTDGGATWTVSQRLTWTSGDSYFPAMATASVNTLHVVWDDSTPGNDDLYYKRSTDGGATWTVSQRLTWTSGETRYPAIAADPDHNLHAVWCDDTPGNREIYYRKGK